jgi:hypothetical protein
MKQGKTARGFSIIKFNDHYGKECSIQESSLSTKSCIWFGIDNAEPQVLVQNKGWVDYKFPENVEFTTRMHLTVKQVEKLIPILQRFVDSETLSLKDTEDKPNAK